jgi:transcriptional regulator with XRE-family HTH domain
MKDRLQKIITSEGLNPSLLADEIGVQRSGISHILSGRNYPSFDFLQKLLVRFPKLNAEWVILGQGTMYQSNQSDEIKQQDLFSPVPPPLEKQEIPENTQIPEISSSGEAAEKQEAIPCPGILPPEELKSKTVEKVIIFYTDKTFRVYLPE